MLLASAMLALLSAAPQPAAEPGSVAILVLFDEAVGLAISDAYLAARSLIERETTLRVAELDVFSRAVRAETIRQCAGDGHCFAKKIRATGTDVDLLLTISADRLGEGYLLGLRLIDVRRGETQPQIAAIGHETPAGTALPTAVKASLPRVFPSELWGVIGEVAIEADQVNAEVSLGARTCVTPCKLSRVRVGRHEVLIVKAGFAPASQTIDVRRGETESVRFELVPNETALVASPLFWGAVGVGAVAAGVATFLLVRTSGPDEICIAPRRELCR